MKKILFIWVFVWAATLLAEMNISLVEGVNLRLGGDVRARYEGYTQSTIQPDADKDGRHHIEYLRVRTRVWGILDIDEDLTFNLRLGNRVHYVTTSPGHRNNNGKYTWEFPDETYFDDANVEIKNLLDGHLKLTIGRQNLKFGNGMIFSEGTPFDQGRSLYNDGVAAKFSWEKDTLTIFSFYDSWKDRFVCINDQNRRLRSGDVFTAGAYWTHNYNPAFNWDLYYMFNNIDDKHPDEAERCFPADMRASVHTAGARFFGRPIALLDYSLEGAKQFGRDANSHLDGYMLDARLNFHLADQSSYKPVLGVNFTRFSGDKPGNHRNGGWLPVMSQCPLWGEELIPIMINSNWSNLDALRLSFAANLADKLRVILAATEYFACHPGSNVGEMSSSGGGNHFGLLMNVTANYKINECLNAQVQLSHFNAGDYFANGQDGNWARFEITAIF